MKALYPNSFLNATLARWMDHSNEVPRVDCRGCKKPLKCCDFQPFVPNFLLGGWLSKGHTLPQSPNLTYLPVGAVATCDYKERHQLVKPEDRDQDMLCGFYDKGACTLWEFRPGECSVFYCDGVDRGGLSLKTFAIESAVAQMALAELGFGPREIAAQVEILNTGATSANAAWPELDLMYKKAWNWSQTVSAKEVNSWLEGGTT